MKAESRELPREEWDFRAIPEKGEKLEKPAGGKFNFLPDDEVSLCWCYEFTRDKPEWTTGILDADLLGRPAGTPYKVGNVVANILDWRTGAKNPQDFHCLLDHYSRTHPFGAGGRGPIWNWFYHVWPEWPEKPFLSVTAKDRKARYKAMWGANSGSELRLVPLRSIYRFVTELKAGQEPRLLELGINSRRVELEDDVWKLHPASLRGQEGILPSEVAAFAIDYNLQDKILAKLFKNWVVRRRKDVGYQRQSATGNSATKQDRADLRALGATRLLDSGLSIEQAREYTRRVSGVPLYRSEGDWSGARRRTKEALWQAN